MINMLAKSIKNNLSTTIQIVLLIFSNISSIEASELDQSNFSARLAIVDIQTILEHSIAMQEIRKYVRDVNSVIQKDITKKEIDLKTIEEELIRKKNSLSANDFEHEVNNFNELTNKSQREIQTRKLQLEQIHSEAVSIVQNSVIEIIQKLADKYNLNVVLPSSQILFMKNTLDITPEVITQLNLKLKLVPLPFP